MQLFADPEFLAVVVREQPDLNAPVELRFIQKHTLSVFIAEEVQRIFGANIAPRTMTNTD